MMKASDLRSKSATELEQLQLDLLKEQFNLRMQQGSGRLTKTHLLGLSRQNLARVKTIIHEKKSGEAS